MTAISICTTNYQCGHALPGHLASVYRALEGIDFEYIIVDNRSRDGSWQILNSWARVHANFVPLSRRCTMGEGRQIAFRRSVGRHIMVIDTDVEYTMRLREFVDAYLATCPGLSVQAVFCGLFPRGHWQAVGGRRSLNTNEDVDMWLRLSRHGWMRWYPIVLGENRKEGTSWGSSDFLSRRYTKGERIVRLLRREWDLLKTREVQRTDLRTLIESNTIDLGLGPPPGPWPQRRTRSTTSEHAIAFLRDLRQVLRTA